MFLSLPVLSLPVLNLQERRYYKILDFKCSLGKIYVAIGNKIHFLEEMIDTLDFYYPMKDGHQYNLITTYTVDGSSENLDCTIERLIYDLELNEFEIQEIISKIKILLL